MRICVFSLHLILMNPPGSKSTTMRPAVGSTVSRWCTWRPGTMDSARTAPYTIYVYYFTFCLFGGENKIMSMWFTFVKMFWHNWNSVSHERKFPITVVSLIQYIFQFLQVSFLPAMSLSHSQLPLQPVIVHYITAFNENYLLLTLLPPHLPPWPASLPPLPPLNICNAVHSALPPHPSIYWQHSYSLPPMLGCLLLIMDEVRFLFSFLPPFWFSPGSGRSLLPSSPHSPSPSAHPPWYSSWWARCVGGGILPLPPIGQHLVQ